MYFHTLRYLRPIQYYSRLRKFLVRSKPSLSPSPPLRQTKELWRSPLAPESSISGNECSFLNRTRTLDFPGIWNDDSAEKLWLYNLHYFDFLNSDDATLDPDFYKRLVSRWIHDNPPCSGIGWEPYPLSRRIVSWIKWFLAGNVPSEETLFNLVVQTRALNANIEYHLLGNHLLANAKALIFAGLFYEGAEPDAWLTTGIDILKHELPEQILADGGHFERSAMYHSVVLEDLLDIIKISGMYGISSIIDFVNATVKPTANRMRSWLDAMLHPDQRFALFNDAAFGIAPSPRELEDYARELGLEALTPKGEFIHLDQSGYIRLQTENAVLFLDVGRIGPDYVPGHAHADTLSFEMSLFGQRFCVDTGTFCYSKGKIRSYVRSTPAHNTVSFRNANSSEIWDAFRVGRRAYPFNLEIRNSGNTFQVSCSHDGYRRLRGSPIHRRTWTLNSNSLVVSDTITADGSAIAHFHFDPSLECLAEGKKGQLVLPDGKIVNWKAITGHPVLARSKYYPEFGKVQRNRCLNVMAEEGKADIMFEW